MGVNEARHGIEFGVKASRKLAPTPNRRSPKEEAMATSTLPEAPRNWNQTPEGRAYAAKWRAENKEKIAAANKAYRAANKEKIAASMAKWSAENKDRKREYNRAYYAANKEKCDAHKAKWNARNEARLIAERRTPEFRARNRETARARRRKNPEKYAAEAKKYREENGDYFSEYMKKWRADNPEKVSEYNARRYARERGAEGSHTAQEWRDKCAEFGHLCAYCGKKRKLTRDHVVPVSRCGSDDIANIVPACKSCNSKKRARLPEEFQPAKAVA